MKKLLFILALIPFSVMARNPFLSNELKQMIILAEQNNAEMQYEVGKRFYQGEGVGTDKKTAIMWLERSAKQGYVPAQKAMGLIYLDGDGDIAADPAKGIEWFERSAAQNDIDSQVLLAKFYKDGQLVKTDYAKAGQWAQLASSQNSPAGHYYLATLHHFGQGREVNLAKAFELYQKAGAGRYAEAFNNLAGMYFIGQGTAQNNVQAYAHWIVGAKLGSPQAAKNLEIKTKENVLNDAQKKEAENIADAILRRILGQPAQAAAPKAKSSKRR